MVFGVMPEECHICGRPAAGTGFVEGASRSQVVDGVRRDNDQERAARLHEPALGSRQEQGPRRRQDAPKENEAKVALGLKNDRPFIFSTSFANIENASQVII